MSTYVTHVPALTLDDIEARNFTFVTGYFREPFDIVKFLVATPSEPEARKRAPEVFTKLYPGTKQPDEWHFYPRNYVRKARVMLAEGRAE